MFTTQMLRKKRDKLRRAFSLIEMAVVLVIITLLMGGAISLVIALMEGQGVDLTNERMDHIQLNLEHYAHAKGHLPCPANINLKPSDANFGVGVGSGTAGAPNCSAANWTSGTKKGGGVPVRTLQMLDIEASDGFGRAVIYRVDEPLTVEDAAELYPMGSNIGTGRVLDDGGVGANRERTAQSIYELISFGANGFGAPGRPNSTNPDELKNSPAGFDNVLVQKTLTGNREDSAGNFDDIVRYSLLFDMSGTGAVITASSSGSSGGSSGSSTGGAGGSTGGGSTGGSSSGGSTSASSGSSSGGYCDLMSGCYGNGMPCDGRGGECCDGFICTAGTCQACASGPPWPSGCGCNPGACAGGTSCVPGACGNYCNPSGSSSGSGRPSLCAPSAVLGCRP